MDHSNNLLVQKLIRRFHQYRPAYREKVFGIGYPKTGTTTLGACLKRLGYKHKTFDMNLAAEVRRGSNASTIEAAKKYESFEDWPWFLVYEALDKAYPSSKFILTKRRNADAYVASARRHRERQGVYERDFQEPTWWRDVFDYAPNYWDEELYKNQYNLHNESVIKYFDGRPNKLLVVCWEDGCGWNELCDFLGRPVVKDIFPHLNKSG